ncbi:hypothetical protein [Bacteroides sp.]|uniref:hypothetical protein n=1 Tax=Bacteroides sp. TaxID=29523 RepID=UPI002623A69F|nr:hypothetical protein [Bacteroides sp.]
MKKIIIIGVSPLVRRRADVFYIDEFINKGYKVEHCDLSPCFYINDLYNNIITSLYTYTFSTIDDFKAYLNLQVIKDTVFIVELLPIKRLEPIFKILKDYRCYCIRINVNASDMSEKSPTFMMRIKYGLWGLSTIKSLLKFTYKKCTKSCVINSVFDIYSLYISSGNNKKIDIHINQYDWDKTNRKVDRVISVDYKYAIFCDEYFPYHPDFKEYNLDKVNAIASMYHNQMNSYFDYIENKYHIKIVIAAHPKSNYEGNEFGDRPILKFKTMELVKYSEFVILHGSMSISYAILFDKPIVLTITPLLKKTRSYFGHFIIYADYFGQSLNDITKNMDCPPTKVSDTVKNKYIYEYMTSKGIEEKSNVDILDELFRSL